MPIKSTTIKKPIAPTTAGQGKLYVDVPVI